MVLQNQMEILELEMRARAIKAMLNAQVGRAPLDTKAPEPERVIEEEAEEVTQHATSEYEVLMQNVGFILQLFKFYL